MELLKLNKRMWDHKRVELIGKLRTQVKEIQRSWAFWNMAETSKEKVELACGVDREMVLANALRLIEQDTEVDDMLELLKAQVERLQDAQYWDEHGYDGHTELSFKTAGTALAFALALPECMMPGVDEQDGEYSEE